MNDFDKNLCDRTLKQIEKLDENKLITKLFYPKTFVFQLISGVLLGVVTFLILNFISSNSSKDYWWIVGFITIFFITTVRTTWTIKNLLQRIKELENRK